MHVLGKLGAVQRLFPPRHGGSVVGENVPVFDPPRKPVSTGSKRSYQDMDKVSNCITFCSSQALHASLIALHVSMTVHDAQVYACRHHIVYITEWTVIITTQYACIRVQHCCVTALLHFAQLATM